jgi:hypothetical protein
LRAAARAVALLFIASPLVLAACEVAFPFNRSLIPEDAGASTQVDAGVAEDSALPLADSAPAPDEGSDVSPVSVDGSSQDATTDGSADATDAADAAMDSEEAPDEGADGSAE